MKSNARILIVIPKYTFTDDVDYRYPFPLGLGYISSVLKQAGHDVSCLNLNHIKGSVRDIVDKSLCEKKYDYVLTGGNSLTYAIIEQILDAARGHETRPSTGIGGPVITSEPEVVFNGLRPDFAVIGEGERTIVELLDCVANNGDLENVKGIGYRDKGGKARFTPLRLPIEDLDSIPFPDVEGIGVAELLDHSYANDYYVFDYPRPYHILASRGCPFKCTFCYHYEKYRARSLDNVMKEIRAAIERYRINIVSVLDECFSIKKDRLDEFCERMKALRKELSLDLQWTCQMTAKSVDRERLKAMKEAGCYTISYGFESYSPVVLKSMQKPVKPEHVDMAFKMTLDAGIAVQANFIFGDVVETKKTYGETLDYWKKNCKGQVGLSLIQPYPGSEIYERCVKKGIIADKLDFIKNELPSLKTFNMTDGMSDKEFERMKKEIRDTESSFMERVKPISLKKMKENVYAIKLKCPYCKEVITYGNCYIGNRFLYRFRLMCRNCHMWFYVVNLIQKIVWIHHSRLKGSGVLLKVLRKIAKFKG